MKILMMMIVLISLGQNVSASEKPTLGEWIKSEVDSQVVEANATPEAEASMTEEGWYFNLLRVRLRAVVGFDLLAKLEVKPYIELHFARSNPEGFDKYKPAL